MTFLLPVFKHNTLHWILTISELTLSCATHHLQLSPAVTGATNLQNVWPCSRWHSCLNAKHSFEHCSSIDMNIMHDKNWSWDAQSISDCEVQSLGSDWKVKSWNPLDSPLVKMHATLLLAVDLCCMSYPNSLSSHFLISLLSQPTDVRGSPNLSEYIIWQPSLITFQSNPFTHSDIAMILPQTCQWHG